MKKIVSLLMVMLMLTTVLTACSGGGNNAMDSAVFGTIETSRWFSKINYYDAACTLLKSKTTIFPAVGYTNFSAVKSGDKVFAISGNGEFFASDNLIMLDTKENSVKKVSTSVDAIYDLYAQGNGVFLISGTTTHLVRFDIQTKEEVEFKPENSTGEFVYVNGDTVYFLTSTSGSRNLYLLDEKTLTVKKTYDVTDYFYTVNEMLVVKNKLYIAPNTDSSSDKNPANYLVCLDLEKETFEKIELETKQSCYDMALYEEKLIVLNRDTHDPYEQDITIVDLNTHDIQTIEFSVPLENIEVKGDRLYCLTDSVAIASDNSTMFVCDLSEPDFPVMIKADLSTNDSCYVSAFFMM